VLKTIIHRGRYIPVTILGRIFSSTMAGISGGCDCYEPAHGARNERAEIRRQRSVQKVAAQDHSFHGKALSSHRLRPPSRRHARSSTTRNFLQASPGRPCGRSCGSRQRSSRQIFIPYCRNNRRNPLAPLENPPIALARVSYK